MRCIKIKGEWIISIYVTMKLHISHLKSAMKAGTTAENKQVRLFRTEKSYAVTSGKWYFEFEVLTAGEMKVGWAQLGVRPDVPLGSDDQAYIFDGHKVS